MTFLNFFPIVNKCDFDLVVTVQLALAPVNLRKNTERGGGLFTNKIFSLS